MLKVYTHCIMVAVGVYTKTLVCILVNQMTHGGDQIQATAVSKQNIIMDITTQI